MESGTVPNARKSCWLFLDLAGIWAPPGCIYLGTLLPPTSRHRICLAPTRTPLWALKKNPASCSCATMAADPALRRAAPTPQKPRWRWPRCITSWQSHFTSHFFGSVVCLCAATSLRWRRSLDTHANVRSTFVAFGEVAGVQAAYDSGARIIVRFHGPPHGMVPQEPAGGVFKAGVQRMGG